MSYLPEPPSRGNPSTFAALADAFLAALPDFGDVMETLALAASEGSFQGAYAGGTTYSKGQTVVDGGIFYVSLQNANTGHTPSSSSAWWYAPLDGFLSKTDPAITGTIKEDIYTITDGAAFEIDPGNGSIQKITLTASRTPKFTNFQNGESILLLVDDGTSYTLTWTDTTAGASGVKWKDAASAPSLDATAMTGIILWKFGGQVYGVNAGTFA